MKVCILGGGITSLTLAKALAKLDINIDIYSNEINKAYDKSRTLGISKSNINFFNQNILNINKLLWEISKIKIYSESLKNQQILNFEDDTKKLFSMIRNFELNDLLFSELKKNKLIKFKKNFKYYSSNKNGYKLIFNCDLNNSLTKKFFFNNISKDYKSIAYTTIIKHQKISNNNIASQFFTKKGPLAFLPLSSNMTSIVYSVRGNKRINLKDEIKKYNKKLKNCKLSKIHSFKLKASNLRSYYHKNVLAFGDLLHKIHPLAGQGFNMTIRDIKEIFKIIKFRIDLGLDLDSSICVDFEKNTRHKNYLFSNGVDFIYEFFNTENKINNNILSKSAQLFGKNKTLNKFFINYANYGII